MITVVLKKAIWKDILKQFMKSKSYMSVYFANFSWKDVLKIHIERVHEKRKPNKCTICDYSCSERGNLKNILNQFMRKWSHTIAQFVILVFIEYNNWEKILNQFMRKRDHTIAPFVTLDFLKRDIWKNICNQFMKKRSDEMIYHHFFHATI